MTTGLSGGGRSGRASHANGPAKAAAKAQADQLGQQLLARVRRDLAWQRTQIVLAEHAIDRIEDADVVTEEWEAAVAN